MTLLYASTLPNLTGSCCTGIRARTHEVVNYGPPHFQHYELRTCSCGCLLPNQDFTDGDGNKTSVCFACNIER